MYPEPLEYNSQNPRGQSLQGENGLLRGGGGYKEQCNATHMIYVPYTLPFYSSMEMAEEEGVPEV